MKLTWHLVRADLRRFRWLLIVWLLVHVAAAVFSGSQPYLAADDALMTAVSLMSSLFFMIRWLGLFLLVPLVVQSHPLVGSDAFWMTRPIAWRQLLSSKLILLGAAIVAIPVACEWILMMVCEVPTKDIVPVAAQKALLLTAWLLIALAAASFTRNLPRYALVIGGAATTLVLALNVMFAIAMRSVSEAPQLERIVVRAESGSAPAVALYLVIIIGGLSPVAWQYRTRRTAQSVAVGIAALAIAWATAMFWPTRQTPVPVPEWARRETAATLAAESPRGAFRPYEQHVPWRSGLAPEETEGWVLGGAQLRLREMEQGWIAHAYLDTSSVEFADGTRLPTLGNGYERFIPLVGDGSPLRTATRHALGVEQVQDGTRRAASEPRDSVAIVLRQEDYRRREGSTGRYRGQFIVNLDRIEIVDVLPLQPAAESRQPGRRLVIDQVRMQSERVAVRLRQYLVSSASGPGNPLSFYLRNRRTSEAVAGSYADQIHHSLPFLGGLVFAGPGFTPGSYVARFPQDHVRDFAISADWLANAELVLVQQRRAGSLTRTIEIDGFEIAAAPRQSTQ